MATDTHHHNEHHDEPSWIRKYIFSTDHKTIGIQYGLTALVFLFFGFCLMMMMRWQLAYPGQALPYLGKWLGEARMPGGVMSPEFYNQLGAMHGTIMVFLGVVPLAVGAYGNYLVPLQVGAQDMAFPKLNMSSYWVYFIGGVIMFASFFVPEGAAQSGWTSYAPLSIIATPAQSIFRGQTMWLLGMVFLITSSLLGSVNIIVTIIQLRAPGLTWMRLPFFCWAQLVTSFLLLLAFPPLEAAGVMQLMDRLTGSSFFMPSGLVISGKLWPGSGGGSALLWQHLFWFLAHPEVYVLILPAMGIIAEIIANNTRKPLWGYKALVWASALLGFLSFVVWAHHMYLTGMGTAISSFFQTTTMLISVPSIIILTALILSLWGGSIRFTTPMCFALAFLPMFGIGGLTGLPLGLSTSDIQLHDTYYVIGHFHYVVAPGTIFALFAGVYYWFPKITGRMMSEKLGKWHFWGSLLFMNTVFMPMFIQGMAGMSRRMYDGGEAYLHNQHVLGYNRMIGMGAWGLGLVQLFFIVNFFWSLKFGKKATDNPWEATTLEWNTPTPPPHGNFTKIPTAFRGPYEYSLPGSDTHKDYYPQWEPDHVVKKENK
ncbi:MAG: cbb3-type cytochrome c oxidase subunit I [Verrucomicrobiota bacterium]